MLSRADNELLVHVGPGTPMGNLFRRFWTPIALASELDGPASAKVPVRVLGEDFVAFRDGADELGLLDAHRPYPVLQRGALLWAYLGPPGLQPEFPSIDILDLPETHRHVVKIVAGGNYLQFQEGDVDSSHVAFLHSRLDGAALEGSRLRPNTYLDKAPRWFPLETDYGLMLSAQRDAGPGQYQWRVNQYLMPHVTLIASQAHLPALAQIRTPIDDEHAILFRYLAHTGRPLSADERRHVANGVTFPELVPGTFTMRETRDNDYLIDRHVQRTDSFTGIRSVVAQDLAVTQEQGDGIIADRSREYLVSSDRGIIMLRKRLLDRVKALQAGEEPPEPRHPKAYAVRSGDFLLPRDVAVTDGGKEILALA